MEANNENNERQDIYSLPTISMETGEKPCETKIEHFSAN